jgi:hypothetical protein
MWDLSDLSNLFLIAGYVALVVVFLLVVWLYGRVTRVKGPLPSSGQNLAEMAILYQSMRGVIDDQKTLAREFNRSVDSKVTVVRQVIGKVVERQEALAKAQEELNQRVEELNRALAFAEDRVARLKGRPAPVKTVPEPLQRAVKAAVPESRTPDEEAPVREFPSFHAIAKPEESAPGPDLIDTWVGLDFVGEEAGKESSEAPENVPEAPRDPESSRQAFRTLMSMQPEAPAVEAAPKGVETDAGNGRKKNVPLRNRVFEYYDAGMSVAEIASELGVGKGEVRLMLSLRGAE